MVRLVGRLDLGSLCLPIQNRSIVDATPYLALLLVPIVERVVASRPLRVVCGLLVAWSIAVQFIGAYSYSLTGWSDLWRDYDRPEQASLWLWDRPQIGFHLAHFRSERARKKQVMTIYRNHQGPIREPARQYRRSEPVRLRIDASAGYSITVTAKSMTQSRPGVMRRCHA